MYDVICPALGTKIRIKDLVFKNYEVPGKPRGTSTKCIEYTVVGNHREWPDYATLEDFQKANPDIMIEELSIN